MWIAGANSTKLLRAALTSADPKSTKDIQVISVFLCFWDLKMQKLLVKC